MTVKKLTALGMFSAIAFLLTLFIRFPVVLFLRYDPKDVIITFAGFIYGPVAALMVAVVVATAQMITVSGTGFYGLFMNIISSAAFCCTASYIYHRKRTLKSALIGLVTAVFVTTTVMMAWNYVVAPLFLGQPRSEIVHMLLPVFLPFNLLQGSLNAAFTVLLYKPIKNALMTARVMPQPQEPQKFKVNFWAAIVCVFIIITCALWILMLQGVLR